MSDLSFGIGNGELVRVGEYIRGDGRLNGGIWEDPTMPYRVRAAMGTFSLTERGPDSLGYSLYKTIDLGAFVACFDGKLEGDRYSNKPIADALLDVYAAMFADFDNFLSGTTEHIGFPAIPSEVALIGLCRVIAARGLDRLDSDPASGMASYLTSRCGMTIDDTAKVIDFIGRVHADKLLGRQFQGYGNVPAVWDVRDLAGPKDPSMEYSVGFDAERALATLAKGFFFRYHTPEYLDPGSSYGDFGNREDPNVAFAGLNVKIFDALTSLGVDEDALSETLVYQLAFGYLRQAFESPTETTFDGVQLTNSVMRLDDKNHLERWSMSRRWLDYLSQIEGDKPVAHAVARFGSEIADTLRYEMAMGASSDHRDHGHMPRASRITMLTEMIAYVGDSYPEFVDSMLGDPVIGTALRFKANRFANPFSGLQQVLRLI